MWPQISVRPLTFQMNLREPFTFNMAPAFAALMDATLERRLAAYRDPEWRSRALEDLETRTMIRPNWAALEVAESTAHPEMIDRHVVDLAAERDSTPFDFMLDLSIDERPRHAVPERAREQRSRRDRLVAPAGRLPDRPRRLRRARSQLCDACLPTDLLGNWVREREVITLEHAVHKLTVSPPTVFGLDAPTADGVGCEWAWPPTSRSSTRRPSRPDRCAASATSPPTASG